MEKFIIVKTSYVEGHISFNYHPTIIQLGFRCVLLKGSIKSLKIGITGLPSSGKTEAIVDLVGMLQKKELTIGGMVTLPVKEGLRTVGFKVVNWLTREEADFAHRDMESKHMAEGFGVDTGALVRVGIPAIEHSVRECDITIIDEVGKLQFECEEFITTMEMILKAGTPLLLTLHKKSRHPILQEIRRRDDMRILEVTRINRKLLPYKVMDIFLKEWGRRAL